MLRRKILVVDCTALLFRYHHSRHSEPYPSPKGMDIGAVVSVLKALNRMLNVGRPMGLAAVFDAGRITFRNELFPAYKEQREPTPPELKCQFPILYDCVKAIGIPTFREPGFEADDLMATFSRIAKAHDTPAQLISVDKDLHQLVSDAAPYIQQVDIFARRIIDENGVKARLGVPPELVVDFQALVGDSADNIPGIKGVGPKTAARLLNHFGSIESIYDNLSQILDLKIRGAQRVSNLLIENKDSLELMRTLVRLRSDVPMPLDEDHPMKSLRWNGVTEEGETLLKSYGVGWMAKRLDDLSKSYQQDYAISDQQKQ